MSGRSGGKVRSELERARAFLFQRQRAYQHVFSSESVLAKEVLEDLARFCRADESTFHMDARAHALAEGRREVWLRVQDHLKLESEVLWQRFNNGKG